MWSKIRTLAALGAAAGAGYTFALQETNLSVKKSLPGLPTFATVSAAEASPNALVPSDHAIVPQPAPSAPRITQVMRFGFPSLSNIRSLSDFVISYDTRNRVPNWVFEHLTAESLAKGEGVTREDCSFHEDESFNAFFRAQNRDYKGSGFDRGHMAAAGNHRRTQEDCKQTFLLSNMAPQVGRGFNRDKWNDLETYCRKLTKTFTNVYVCTGPLYLPRQEGDGKLYVKYQVIGSNHVAVPTHFFKVLVTESSSGELSLESFLMPNAAIDDAVPIQTFRVPPEVVERAAGLLFFDKVSRDKISQINGKAVNSKWW